MATVHAFVRAYSLEPQLALAAVATAGGVGAGDLQMYYRGNGNRDSQISPGMLMATLNYQLFRSTPPEKYATMFLGSYDAPARMLTYSNAGHLPPYVIAGDGSVTQLDTSGTVVGLFDAMSYEESRIPMHPGDIFVAFSDGVTEPENEFGEFGEERLVELIRLHRDQPLSRISDVVTGAVADWIGGNEQPDDVTLVLAGTLGHVTCFTIHLLHVEREEDVSHASGLVITNQEADITFAGGDFKRSLELESRLFDLRDRFRRKLSASAFVHAADFLALGVEWRWRQNRHPRCPPFHSGCQRYPEG